MPRRPRFRGIGTDPTPGAGRDRKRMLGSGFLVRISVIRIRSPGSTAIGNRALFSQSAEYALRAVVHLAALPDHAAPTSTVAEATGAPPLYLAKVFQTLRKAGVVTLRRGGSGGVRLSRSAAEISMYDVVAAIDEMPRITRCPLGVAEHEGALCPLHSRIDGALVQFQAMMRSTTLHELVQASRVNRDGCSFPSPPTNVVSLEFPSPDA